MLFFVNNFFISVTGVDVHDQVTTSNTFQDQNKVCERDHLTEMIWNFHLKSLQTDLMLSRKLHLRDALYYSIATTFPMCGLYVVGSSLNGFGSNSSDMDLCLMITDKELDQRVEAATILENVMDSLKNGCYIRELQLIPAKIPILRIKFKPPYADIVVDLNANNSVSIRNTHLLSYYSAYDWRVRPLVSVVKEWAKRRDINDANRSSFTSYSLVLMVIHYLQCGVKPAILPSLQVAYPKRFGPDVDVRTLNASAPLEDLPGIPHNVSPAVTVGDLLIGFFHYYAFEFDYINDAISVRLGRKIERQFVASRQTTYTLSMAQWNCICIEEPFTRTNTAHSMHNEMLFDSIRKAFSEDYKKLSETRDLDNFLNVKPIAPLPFAATRSSSGTESIPVAKKNLLKEYDLGNVNLSQPNSEGAGTNTECRKEHESEPNNLKACRNKDLSKVDDESRRLVGLIVY
uniref:PAP-associated domain-containing protein n=1 Tax=Syphacia muris TaxID=451379 RepID=A0A0N5ATF7_9BILA